MAGLLDDLASNVMNAASEAVTGMSNEERDELLAKLMSGSMDFNDFLRMTLLMQNEGGVGGVMNSVSSIPGLKNTLGIDESNMGEVEGKMAKYSKVIAAMTEEERAQPNYFLLGEGAAARVAALAEKAELEKDAVEEFFEQFSKMKKFFTKFGALTREGKTKEQIAREMDKDAREEEGSNKLSKGSQFVNPERQKKKLAKRRAAKGSVPPPLSAKGRASGRGSSKRTVRR